MGFFANDLKRRKAEIERESRAMALQAGRRKKIVLAGLVAFVVLSTLTILVVTGSDPEDSFDIRKPESRKMVIDRWVEDGLLLRFDSLTFVAVVDEAKWNSLDYVERSNVALTLGRYCMFVNHLPRPKIRILGGTNGRIMTRINDTDTSVQSQNPEQTPEGP